MKRHGWRLSEGGTEGGKSLDRLGLILELRFVPRGWWLDGQRHVNYAPRDRLRASFAVHGLAEALDALEGFGELVERVYAAEDEAARSRDEELRQSGGTGQRLAELRRRLQEQDPGD